MSSNSPDSKGDYEELRRLLLGSDLVKLETISNRLKNPEEFSSDIGDILPQAIAKSVNNSSQLSAVLGPTVEEIITTSINRDINKFADVLFPVIGPAIRKSIAETFRQMNQSLNRTMEQSLSTQGIKWRLESMRSGVPVAQIALLNGLVYRVEQVFLIHRETGLLLNHVSQEDIGNQNADVVSSMLGAIGDFVGDSFEATSEQSLDRIEVGGISIWIERGPEAFLAVAIRGEAPQNFQVTMQQSLESIHMFFGPALREFNGDTSEFLESHTQLTDCLQAQYKEEKKKSSPLTLLIWILLAGLLLYWLISSLLLSYQQDNYLALLETEPGYVITRTRENDGKFAISGLRDPLATKPEALLALSSLNPEKVLHEFQPYQSLSTDFIAKRAQKILAPPGNVSLEIQDGTLKVRGYADSDWVQFLNERARFISGIEHVDASELSQTIDLNSLEVPNTVDLHLDISEGHLEVTGYASKEWQAMANALALKISGINSYDDSNLKDSINLESVFNPPDSVSMTLEKGVLVVEGKAETEWINSLKAKAVGIYEIESLNTGLLLNSTEESLYSDITALEDIKIFFDVGTTYNIESTVKFDQIANLVTGILDRARRLSRKVKIIVRGYSDSVGLYEHNVFLSQERAEFISQALFNTGISSEYIFAEGLESPVKTERSEAERRHNRRVMFEVKLD